MRIRELLIIVGFLFFACQSPYHRELERVSELIDDKPDSALVILSRMDENKIDSEKDLALYYLLKTKALDKNYINPNDEEHIRYSADYFERHGPEQLRMLSLYYLGLTQKNNNNYSSAIVSFEKAEKYAISVGDKFHLGLIYRNMASVYNRTNNNPSAIYALNEAVSCFADAGKDSYSQYAKLSLAVDYVNNKEYDKAEIIVRELLDSDDYNLAVQSQLLLTSIWAVKRSRPDSEILDSYRRVPDKYFDIVDYCYYATVFSREGQADSAAFYIGKAYQNSLNAVDSASVDYLLSKLYVSQGNYETAYCLVQNALEQQDSLTRRLLEQSVISAKSEYYKQEFQQQELRARAESLMVWLVALMSLFVITALILLFVIKYRQKEAWLKERLASMSLETNNVMAGMVGKMLLLRMENVQKAYALYFKEENSSKREKLFSRIKENLAGIRKEEAVFEELESDLDQYCDEVMTKLSSQLPRITGDKRKTIALFFAKVPLEMVMLVMNSVSVQSLKMQKSRFRKLIDRPDVPDRELFLRLLEPDRPSARGGL